MTDTYNEIQDSQIIARFRTTRGTITIDRYEDSDTVGYHYLPIDKTDPYWNGPIDTRLAVETALSLSWLQVTPENIAKIETAVKRVQEAPKLV